jgi:hypothetical protein
MSDMTAREGAPVSDRHEVRGVVGYFETPDALRRGMERVGQSDLRDPHAYSSIPDIPALEHLHEKSSPVRWVALAGGLTGIATALAMTIWMSWDYPLVVGGKPITSIPPFMVVAFELMILFGSIAAVIGFLFFARLPDLTPSPAYRPPMGVDEWAIFVPAESERERAAAERVLRDAGAVQVAEVHELERGRLQVLRS